MLPIIYSDQFLKHATGRFHPERPERLQAVLKALKMLPWANQLQWQLPTPPEQRDALPWIRALHDPDYIERVQHLATSGGGLLDPDTPVSPDSYQVALLAVNAWLDGVEQVLATGKPAFVLARPPGHHAEGQTGMGFCLFSNAAIAANYALKQPSVERVAILDWDVHHGNGTQALVQNNPQIIYCSLHQSPCYPGTGGRHEQGAFRNVLNLPMPPGSTWSEYQPRFEREVIPFLQSFQADLLIVSAGYDANHADPLAEISLQPQDYGSMTRMCLQVTHRILFGLEGGYDLDALAQSVVATLESCLIATGMRS